MRHLHRAVSVFLLAAAGHACAGADPLSPNAQAHDDAPMLAVDEGEDREPGEGTVAICDDAVVEMRSGEWAQVAPKEEALTGTVLGWKQEHSLVPLFRSDANEPAFAVLGEPGLAAPDFSALAAKGITSTRTAPPSHGHYPEPAYAALPTGGVFVFDDAAVGDTAAYGVFRWSPDAGAAFDTLPMPRTYGAFFPLAVAARSANDVFVGAAVVSAPFPEDFPGCPSIVFESLDGTYLAHFDGHAWKPLAFPGKGRLWSMTLRADGVLAVVSGWPEEIYEHLPHEGAAPAQERWTLRPNGEWQKG